MSDRRLQNAFNVLFISFGGNVEIKIILYARALFLLAENNIAR
jgi:hypothetical protein